MTIIVADTSPINYLVAIGEIGILQKLSVPVWIAIRKALSRD